MKKTLCAFLLTGCTMAIQAQGLTDTRNSQQTHAHNLPIGATRWTGGFWGDRFNVFASTGIWNMWNTWNNPDLSHGFRNFEVAAGTVKGVHHGPPFHDGDMYKWLEACAAVYAVTKDKKLDELMDQFIQQVALAQRNDGYIHTPVVISERNAGIDSHAGDHTNIGIEIGNDHKKAFASRLNFETYNLGHLMTAGIIHWRATGKKTLFNCAQKAADFLYDFLTNDAAELSRNAICPSHYMGAAEMYRATGNPKYLQLAKGLIAIRDSVKNGEDHNQDRIPFRQQYEAMGHAVRANYLYAGVADLYVETGEAQLMKNLTAIWDDIIQHKIYIMGGCGALYDGVSPDGTTYDQPSIQQIHQAYGRQFQLPNEAAHNEICAQIGQLLFSWRMFENTADAKYIDNVENELYNGILSGISLDGKRFFYTEALRRTASFPYTMRWPKERQEYISCFCCPPNTLRTLCEAQEYAYAVKGDTLYVNLFGENRLKTDRIDIEQHTAYPYDGQIDLHIHQAKGIHTLMVRMPSWAKSATINGQQATANSYTAVAIDQKKSQTVSINIPLRPRLMESNPLVEENKNQVAIMYGPLVYCLESNDIEGGHHINDIIIPADILLTPVKMTIDGHEVTALEGEALLRQGEAWNNKTLYREITQPATKTAKLRLIPYYAWDNRGKTDMSIWLPLDRTAPVNRQQTAHIAVGQNESLTDAIRQAREMHRLGQASNVTLQLADSATYYIDQPITLRPEDSHLTITGKGATISGGLNLSVWKREGKLLVADVPEVNGRPIDFRQLWTNGKKAVRARDVADFEQMNRIMTYDKKRQELWIPRQAAQRIAKASHAEMVLHEMWCTSNLRIKSIRYEGDSAAITFHQPEARLQFEHPWPSPMTPDTKHPSPFYLTNAKELIDQPGEWYHDIQTHKLYYMPRQGETASSLKATIPLLETLFRVVGTAEHPVENITIQGINFSHTTWLRPSTQGHVPLQAGMYLTEAYKLRPQIDRPNNHKLDNQGWLGRAAAAVEIYHGDDISFSDCRFEHLGGSGLDYQIGCQGGRVSQCVFTDIAMNGLVCGSFSPEGLETHRPYKPMDQREVCSMQTVAQSEFYDVTNEDWGCVAIAAGYVNGMNIEHNTIHDISYTGISLGWGWNRNRTCMGNNRVKGNLIYNYAQHMYDCAGIYTLGNQPGTIIEENVVRDIARPSYVHDPAHWFYLYTDEGSSHITLRNNWTPEEKYLKNACGPGNTWENNGPSVSESIKLSAGCAKN